MNLPVIALAKFVSFLARKSGRGSGSTWPGHVALNINKRFIRQILKKNNHLKVILIAGTNGKTTTTKLLEFILLKNGLKVFRNAAGANLLNGIASTLIQHSNKVGEIAYDVALFEIDENTLPLVLKEVPNPTTVVLLNLFRDQLDRYGEVNTIAKKWQESLSKLQKNTVLFSNGDDPELSFISQESGLKTHYFGLEEARMSKKSIPHDVDFLYCPKCNTKLVFDKMSYSHMGMFRCPKCHFKRPDIQKTPVFYPLFGTYNIYNTNAASLVAANLFGINYKQITSFLSDFKPAFGRQEVLQYNGKKIIILLSKNPTGFNQSIDAVNYVAGNHTALLLLNDRIPDGRDVSWIWDVDFEELKAKQLFISGDRAYDMGLRIKYTEKTNYEVIEDLEDAITQASRATNSDQTLFILATYSAMLETRKILKGKAIL